MLGGITGFAILFLARKFLLQFVPESLPRLNDISISWGVLTFAIVVSVAAGTIFGLAPAWLTSRLNLNVDAPAGRSWLERFPSELALAPCSGDG